MRFRCLACNYEFDSDEKEVRCPECLRINDIEPVKGDGGADPGRKKFLVPALLLILVIAGLAVYYKLQRMLIWPDRYPKATFRRHWKNFPFLLT